MFAKVCKFVCFYSRVLCVNTVYIRIRYTDIYMYICKEYAFHVKYVESYIHTYIPYEPTYCLITHDVTTVNYILQIHMTTTSLLPIIRIRTPTLPGICHAAKLKTHQFILGTA